MAGPKAGLDSTGVRVHADAEPRVDIIGTDGQRDPSSGRPRASGGVGSRLRSRGLLVAVVGVVAVLAAAGTWAAVGSRSSRAPTATTPSVAASRPPGLSMKLVTAAQLSAAPGQVGHPVFWAGPKAGTQYELSAGGNGAVYVRYLTPGTPVGSPLARFTLVGTYSETKAYGLVQAGARRTGAVSGKARNGALAEAGSASATNAYFAFEGLPLLVEVFDPQPGRAFQMIMNGQIRLVE